MLDLDLNIELNDNFNVCDSKAVKGFPSNLDMILELQCAYRRGDSKAENRVMKKILNKYKGFIHKRTEELASTVITKPEANSLIKNAMWQAAKLYDYSKGAPYITYVRIWIKAYYQEELSGAFLIKIPHDVYIHLNQHNKNYFPMETVIAKRDEYKELHGIELTIGETKAMLAEYYTPTFEDLLIGLNHTATFEQPSKASNETNSLSNSEVINQKTFEDILSTMSLKEEHNTLLQSLKELSEREFEVIVRHFGFNKNIPEGQSLRDIGATMGYSHQGISNIRSTAISKLSASLKKKGGKQLFSIFGE